jgi:cobalt-zinc-cadmium efflux system outer membrane protein
LILKILRGPVLAGSLIVSSVGATADLSLDEAVERALARNPGIAAARAAVVATEQQAALDSLAPPSTVGGELENFAGTGDLSGVDQAETTLRLGHTFELGGKRDARRALGESRVAAQRGAADRRKLDIVAEANHRFLEVLAQQSRLELARQELELARQARDAVAYRVKRGASPEADQALADLAVVRAELELEDAEHELQSARVGLSVLWDEPTPDFERVRGTVESLPEAPALDVLAQRVKAGADARRFELDDASLAAERRVAEAAAKPDLHGTLGVRRLEGLDDQALVMSFSMPFGLRDRADLATSRVRAERDRLAAERRAAELERYRALFATYQELNHTRARYEALRDRMIPSAEQALGLVRRGYDEARYSFLQVAQAQNVLQGLQRDRIATAIEYQELLADLTRATAAAGDETP